MSRNSGRRSPRRHPRPAQDDAPVDHQPGVFQPSPRSFKTAISAVRYVVHEINDVAFIELEHLECDPGLDVLGGQRPFDECLRIGERLRVHQVPLEDVADVCRSARLPLP